MTTNWRDKWQHRTRGGYEVVNVYMLHGLLRASIKFEGSRHPGYAVDENGKAISHSHKYDLIPITPPAEPVPQDATDRRDAERWRHENKQLRLIAQAAKHLLMAATGPEDGPTSWLETRDRLFDRMQVYSVDALPDPVN